MTEFSSTSTLSMPDGSSATFEEMETFGKTLQRFICETESGLPKIRDDRKHDRIVDYLNLLADSYNEQLKRFRIAERKRHERIQMVFLLALHELEAS